MLRLPFIFIFSIRLAEPTNWKNCDDAKTIQGNENNFSDIIFFPSGGVPSVVQKERLNLLDNSLLVLEDQQLEYLMVSGQNVTYCQSSVQDEIFKTALVSCVKKKIDESNFVVISKIGCGTVVAYKKVKNVSPMSVTKHEKFHKILKETGNLRVILREEMLLTGALFAALGATVAYMAISFVYIRFKLLLTQKLDMAMKSNDKKKKSRPRVVRKNSSNSVLTDPDLTTKVKVGLMVKAPKKASTPKVTATPRLLELKDEM